MRDAGYMLGLAAAVAALAVAGTLAPAGPRVARHAAAAADAPPAPAPAPLSSRAAARPAVDDPSIAARAEAAGRAAVGAASPRPADERSTTVRASLPREGGVDAAGSRAAAARPSLAEGAAVERSERAIVARLREALGDEPGADDVRAAAACAERVRAEARRIEGAAEALAAVRVARDLERGHAFLVDHERGGRAAILEGLDASPAHLFPLVGSRERFAPLFARPVRGPAVGGPRALASGSRVGDGATLVFPAGTFACDLRSLALGSSRFPEGLVVAGAGRDATTLRFREVAADGEVVALTLRDATIDCQGGALASLAEARPATIRLERCRVLGFGGASALLALRAGAVWAEDTIFEADARSSREARLFRVSGGLLARFDRCVFRGPFARIWEEADGATFLFEGCGFAGIDARLRDEVAAPPLGVRFVDRAGPRAAPMKPEE